MKNLVTGILAHVDAGKTTLSEALLFEAGHIRKLGRVDNKDSFLDTNAYERERGITIFSKIARIKDNEREIVLVDTPGHVDFSGEMERVLDVLDVAILLISGLDGVQAHTKTVWKLLRARKIPTFIFVNKMDIAVNTKEELLENIHKELSKDVVDFTDTSEERFFEDIATCSEGLLSEYMDSLTVSDNSIQEAVSDCHVFPCFFGSALKQSGVSKFMNDFLKYSRTKEYTDDFGAICYKISKDKNLQRLVHLKLTGGSLKVKSNIGDEKVNEIRLYSGDKYDTETEVFAGNICAVTGLKNVKQGDRLGSAPKGLAGSIEPVLTYAVKYPDDVDCASMHSKLLEIEEEEPGLKVEFNEETKDIYVHLFGEVQTEILTRQIEDRYNIKVSFGKGKILYKETIADVVEGVGHFEPLRHYAEVHLRLEPDLPGTGLTFASQADVNSLALNWQRLILTHLAERIHKGVLTGSPITDMRITLVSGKAHLKHTEGGDFRQATYRAVRQGLMLAESVLLEPFYFYELTVPDAAVGRAMTDIDRMWGNSTVREARDGKTVLTGTAPVATMNGYAKEVLAYTKGQGSLSLSLAGFEPCHNTEEVLSERHYSAENDLKNPCDSVFCSHGAGTVIPWYEVYNYMHLPLSTEGEYETEPEDTVKMPASSLKDMIVTTEEIDEIIKKNSFANQKSVKTAYKGRSASMIERQRIAGKPVHKEPVYKGTTAKEKYMLIDGYNVVHALKELSDIAAKDINGAAGRLMDIVSDYSAMTGIKTILVFDAYKVPGHRTEEIKYHNILVVYTKTAETADHYIERYAHENGKKYDVFVVTSDGVEQVIIRGAGAHLMSSRDFGEDYNKRRENLLNTKLSEGISIVPSDED